MEITLFLTGFAIFVFEVTGLNDTKIARLHKEGYSTI